MDIYRIALSPWFWFALTVVFTLVEMATSFTLVTLWFALSALVMVFVSGFTEMFDAPIRFRLHIGIFLVLSAVFLVFTRPLAVRKFRAGRTRTNVGALIGEAIVITKKVPRHEKGEGKVKGQIWTVISADGGEIEENAECTVTGVDGVKLVVEKKVPEKVSG